MRAERCNTEYSRAPTDCEWLEYVGQEHAAAIDRTELRACVGGRSGSGGSPARCDSLQDNRSRFLAEILRIRQIVGLIRQDDAVLFLLDELLSGTNSHDRLIGASGIVRGLLAGNSIGLLTTHDLALTQIESGENVHFEDSIQDGELEFDYKLRPGIVTHGNALALMRAVGLEV